MIRNLFIASWRSVQKNKSSSLINFFGLVFGFTCILIIGIFIHHELSYDRHHENTERIYRVTHNEKAGEVPGIRHLATVGPPLGPALKQGFTQVEDAVRFRYSPDRIMRVNDHQQESKACKREKYSPRAEINETIEHSGDHDCLKKRLNAPP